MSDSNRAALLHFLEPAWGDVPDQTDVLTYLPFLNESLRARKDTVENETIRSDRQTLVPIRVAVAAEGQTRHELDGVNFSNILRGGIQGAAAVSSQEVALTCSITTGTDVLVASSGTPFAEGTNPGVTKSKWIKIAGAATSANNGVKKILSFDSDTTITLESGSITVTEGTPSLTLDFSYIFNGTTMLSFLMEKEFLDKSVKQHFTGMTPSQLTFELASRERAFLTVDWMGRLSEIGFGGTDSASAGDGTPTAASAADIINCSVDVGNVFEGGTEMTGIGVRSMRLSVNNNLRERPKIGSLYSLQFGSGGVRVEGSMEAYFENATMYQKFLDHTVSSLAVGLTDSSGNHIGLSLPEVYFSQGTLDISGRDSDIVVPLDFTAHRDATLDRTIQMDLLSA